MVEFSSGLKVILTGCCFCTDRNHQITGNDNKNILVKIILSMCCSCSIL